MRIIIIVTLLVLLAATNANAQLADSPWPTFRGNSQRTGLSPYDTSHVDGSVKWIFETGGTITTSPAIGPDGRIYFGADDGYFYCLSPDGTEIWRTKIGTPKQKEQGYTAYTATLASPAIASDGTIYTASRDQFLFALNPDGTEKWRFHLDLTFDNWVSPAIADDGTIYMTSSRPRPGVVAVNPDGTEKWFFEAGADMFNSVSIGEDGTIYAALPPDTRSFRLYAINPDGTEKWGANTSFFLESTPSIGPDGTVYVGTFAKDVPEHAGVYAIKDGEIKWFFETQTSEEIMSTPAIGKDGTIYFGDDGSVFHALNPDGTEKWSFEAPAMMEASPVIGADGTIYIGLSNVPEGSPSFYAFNPDGTVKWKNDDKYANSIVSSAAIGADGTVYVGSFDFGLYAFGGPGEGIKGKTLEGMRRMGDYQGVNPPEGLHQEPGIGSDVFIVIAAAAIVLFIVILVLKKTR